MPASPYRFDNSGRWRTGHTLNTPAGAAAARGGARQLADMIYAAARLGWRITYQIEFSTTGLFTRQKSDVGMGDFAEFRAGWQPIRSRTLVMGDEGKGYDAGMVGVRIVGDVTEALLTDAARRGANFTLPLDGMQELVTGVYVSVFAKSERILARNPQYYD